MLSKLTRIIRWIGAIVMLLLILSLMVEGTWAVPLHRGWPFVCLCLLAVVLLLITGVLDLRRRAWTAALSHWGLVLLLMGGMLGAVAETDVKMVVDRHASERVAYTAADEVVVLPFSIRLQDFRIDYYADSVSPKQYTSRLQLIDCQSSSLAPVGERDLSVNHPLRFDGWWIYQFDYDRANQDFVVLQLVRDPWLPMVYVGFLLMALGALAQTIRAWHSWKVLPATLALAVVFTAASLARVELGTLPPALRSLWFFPHILIYMIAYSLLAFAMVLSILQMLQKPQMVHKWYFVHGQIVHRLLATTSALLLIGMLCGAVWAKDAWGQYWTWDAKECWAAVTWLITIVGSHLPMGNTKSWRTFVVILLTFAAMQVTWYGVNYLPASEFSMHTYNR